MRKQLSGKPLLPRDFKSESRLDEIKGVYVPFWLFDAHTEGSVRYHATKVKHWSDSDYHYTKTSHYTVYRDGSLWFDKVPVDGSSRMSDEYMESIEPYDYSKLTRFSTAYLAGFVADRYDVDAASAFPPGGGTHETQHCG